MNCSSRGFRYAIAIGFIASVAQEGLSPAEAGGFQVTSLCGKCQGRRNAGEAAAADTPATVFFNPAGLTYLQDKNQLDTSVIAILPKTSYDDRASRNPFGGLLRGNNSAETSENAPVPNLYYSHPINRKLVVGLGINTPYGLSTKYNDGWVGRYHATKSELLTVNINPGFGFRVTPQMSIGFGLNATYADTTLKNAIDFGSAFGISPNNRALEGESKLEGHDWGFGWNAGLLYETQSGTRLGVSYRSEIETTLEGHSETTMPAIPGVAPASSSRVSAKAKLKLPATLRLGVYQPLRNPDWAVLAGATWTDWSTFDEIRVKFSNDNPDLVQPQKWKDNWRLSLGVEYRASPRLALRGGVEYDRTPIRGNAVKTPRIPGTNLTWLSFGLSYAVIEDSLDLDFSYSYVFTGKHDIDDTEIYTPYISGLAGGNVGGNRLDGEFDGHAHIFGAGLRWRF